MTEEQRVNRSLTAFIKPLIESIIIFCLLLSGIGIIFISKMLGQVGTQLLFLGIGLGVEIFAIILIGIIFYIQFFRFRVPEPSE